MRKHRLTSAMMVIKTVRPIAPPTDPVACWKMAMRGTPVAVVSIASRLRMQKNAAMRKMKPEKAPIQTDQMIARGASFLALRISSVMCAVASYPVIPNAACRIPRREA